MAFSVTSAACSRQVAFSHKTAAGRKVAVVRCTASNEDGQPSTSQADSSNFKSNLRKGFQPQKRKPEPKPTPAAKQNSGPLIFGADDSEEAWRQIDKKLNKYPGYRTFTAIGSGGAEFKAAMVSAVAEIVGTIHEECVSERPSSQGAYLSVKIGPVVVKNPEQVIQIFSNMKKDPRLKWVM